MRPLPQSLYDRAELLSRVHKLSTVAEILKVRPNTLSVMRARGWKALSLDPRLRPVPTDFCIQARHMTHAELQRHYRAGNQTITRWLHEKQPRPKMKPGPKPRRAN